MLWCRCRVSFYPLVAQYHQSTDGQWQKVNSVPKQAYAGLNDPD